MLNFRSAHPRHCEEQRDEAIQNDMSGFIQTFYQSLTFASRLPRRYAPRNDGKERLCVIINVNYILKNSPQDCFLYARLRVPVGIFAPTVYKISFKTALSDYYLKYKLK